MLRRAVAVGAISLGFIAVLPAVSTAAAMRPQVIGVGITTCHPDGGGGVSFSPPLMNSGTSSSETVTLSATGKPCTGGTPTPHSFTLKAHASVTGVDVNMYWELFFAHSSGFGALLGVLHRGNRLGNRHNDLYADLRNFEVDGGGPANGADQVQGIATQDHALISDDDRRLHI